MDDGQKLDGTAVADEGLNDWRMMVGGLYARFETGSFAAGLDLVNQVGAAAEEADHHPDIDLRYPLVNIKLVSHDVGGITARDVRLARRISELAAAAGAPASPADMTVVEIALDTSDADAIRPFWKAVLGTSEDDGELVDDKGSVPTIWFQDTDPHGPPRQRFHADVWVPHDVARDRMAKAIAAGGTLVSDDAAPSFWVLADVQGNKACICTWQDRA